MLADAEKLTDRLPTAFSQLLPALGSSSRAPWNANVPPGASVVLVSAMGWRTAQSKQAPVPDEDQVTIAGTFPELVTFAKTSHQSPGANGPAVTFR